MAKHLRPGKVFIDWSQNSDFKTTVSVYSLRAKTDEPFVSAPVTWDELAGIRTVRDAAKLRFTPEQALKRVENQGDLFAPLLTMKQRLPARLDESHPKPAPRKHRQDDSALGKLPKARGIRRADAPAAN